MELHHIVQKADGGEDSFRNCIPLCFDCHADVKAYNPRHPKGRKYTDSELIRHRNRWYEKVKNEHLNIVNSNCLDLDRKLFLKIREILASRNGPIYFIRNHIYTNPFPSHIHQGLQQYWLQCENPDFEFIDLDLEIRRSELTDKINTFLNVLNRVTFTVEGWENNDQMAVHPDIKYSDRETYYQAIKDIDQAAKKVCVAYDDLIRLGRRKLAVE